LLLGLAGFAAGAGEVGRDITPSRAAFQTSRQSRTVDAQYLRVTTTAVFSATNRISRMDTDLQQHIPGSEEKNWALAAHAASLIGFIIPFGNIIGPMIVWLMKREQMPYVNEQGKEALNFNITILICTLISLPLMFIVIGIFLLFVLFIAWLICTIIAIIKSSEGVSYRYPFTLRLIK
jgi:uncharacterized protein